MEIMNCLNCKNPLLITNEKKCFCEKCSKKLGEKATKITDIFKKINGGSHIVKKELGDYLYKGMDINVDYCEALIKWYKKAAEQGDVDAQNYLGDMYLNDEVVKKDLNESFKWYKASAEQGNIYSQVSLGEMYRYGGGPVEKNLNEAFKWYKKAAEQGNEESQAILGDMFFYGKGVEKDLNEAFKWYKESAEQGYPYSIFCLADCYYYGYGTEKNLKEAYKLYKIAADTGYEDAQNIVVLGFNSFDD